MNISQALFALNQTLLQHENIAHGALESDSNTDDLIHHYNCGNLNEVIFNLDSQFLMVNGESDTISPEQLAQSKKIDDYIRTHLIINRNIRMAKQIVKLLNANPNESFFFVFGAGM